MSRFSLLVSGDEEPFTLGHNITLGRHLDNDLVLAGEDVHEYHARIELSPRGATLVPLSSAVVLLNDRPVDAAIGLGPGDRMTLGQHLLILRDNAQPGAIEGWELKALDSESVVPLEGDILVGRGENCELRIQDSHISRVHARFSLCSGNVWLHDMSSSNGTFVNGDRLMGSWEVFHGDEVFFDRSGFQLVGRAPDITPVITHRGQYSGSGEEQPQVRAQTELALPGTAEVPSVANQAEALISAVSVTGPCIEGVNEFSQGQVIPLEPGHYIVGRAPESEIYLPESSVSLRHAEIERRLDGCYLINLISTNGTWVNGEEIQTARLNHGDVLSFGRVQFRFRDEQAADLSPSHSTSIRWKNPVHGWGPWVIVSFIAAALLLAAIFYQ